MHYPLHITVLCTTLWILRDDAYAVKTGFNAEVLTSFAKNVASILSTTLLGEYQAQSANQLSSSLLKKIQDDPSLLNSENIDDPSSKSSSGRRLRHARSSKEVRGAFQDGYVTPNPSGHSKYHDAGSYVYAVSPDARITSRDGYVESTKNADTKGNSIDADINAASVYYSDRRGHSPGLGILPNPVHPSVNSNHYGHPAFRPRYHHTTTSGNVDEPSSVDPEAARLTRGPYNPNYQARFHPDRQFDGQQGFYPYGRPIEGNGQPSSGQDESNPSRLIDDQNQGQTALGGYGYGPRFHYRPPYYDGFYHGFPEFPYYRQNASYNHANVEQAQGNSTGGHQPYYGPAIFPYYKFNPYFPYHSGYPPYFDGHGRPVDAQNSPGNAENGENMATENGQDNGNGTTGYRPPYGFPPYGPFYGDFYLPKYPLTFHGYPYHFNHGYHNHFFPYFKPGPYFHFPFFHSYPYFGPYHRPYYNGHATVMADKPMQEEKMGENAEATPANDQAEMISESKAEKIRYGKSAPSWMFGKDVEKIPDRVQTTEIS